MEKTYLDTAFICGWGIAHPFIGNGFEHCFCYKKYGSDFAMTQWLLKKGYDIKYPKDITGIMRDQYFIESPPLVY